MPARVLPRGYIYHVMNRAVAGTRLFDGQDDYRAFERALAEACKRVPIRILAYCLMPNHFHLVIEPLADGDLARFMHWLTTTHAVRWRRFRDTAGRGHLYQGRYRAIPIEDGVHLTVVLRYVERNALRANLVTRAEDWRWCSLWRRRHPHVNEEVPPLSDVSLGDEASWLQYVNQPLTTAEVKALRTAIRRGVPFGTGRWHDEAVHRLGLESKLRPRGRPRKKRIPAS